MEILRWEKWSLMQEEAPWGLYGVVKQHHLNRLLSSVDRCPAVSRQRATRIAIQEATDIWHLCLRALLY